MSDKPYEDAVPLMEIQARVFAAAREKAGVTDPIGHRTGGVPTEEGGE